MIIKIFEIMKTISFMGIYGKIAHMERCQVLEKMCP